MDKNTLTGFLLIGAILLGFTVYNENQMEKQREVQQKIDSAENIVKEQQLAKTKENTIYIDSLARAERTYSTAQLNDAAKGTERFYTLENDRIIAKISNRGAAIKSVELKSFKTFNEEPLFLFKEKDSKFNLELYANSKINTSDFYFENRGSDVKVLNDGESQSMVFTLPLNDQASVEYIYTLAAGSNIVDFKIKLNNTQNILSAGQSNLLLNWANVAPQQERGYSYESNYTTVTYMFPDEDSMEELSITKEAVKEDVDQKIQWVAFKQQFFSSVLIAKDNFSKATLSQEKEPENSGNIKDFEAMLSIPYSADKSEYDFSFYFGSNNYSELKDLGYHLNEIVPLGWGIFSWVNKLIVIPTFNFLSSFISNYGLIILLLTIFIKILLFFFTYKSYISMAKMRLIKPEIDELNAKFPDKDQALEKQQATMELYRRAGVNPLGGCLPMLLQLPVLFALFKFFPASIELRGASFLWIKDLSSYDSILTLPFSIPFYGDHVSLMVILMSASLIVSTKINSMNNNSSQQLPGMNAMMTWGMPIMMLFIFNSFSSGLCYYYFLANVITILQTIIIRRFVDDNKLHQQMKDNAKKPKKKSKLQSRYEEMLNQQKQQMEQNRR